MNQDNIQPWRWCLVGNIVETHEYGEEKEIKFGTKQFRPGAKVYLAPANWGDGYENIVVIGCPRKTRNFIEIIMRSEYVENLRIQKVYAPFLLHMMEKSQYEWWDDSDRDHDHILSLIDSINSHRCKND